MTPLQKARHRTNLLELQTLCSENYARLRRLWRAIGDAASLDLDIGKAGSVHLAITATSRYTTDLALVRTGHHPLAGALSMSVRLYHDMRLAEVLHMQTGARTQANNPYPNADMHQPDEKHQWNRFLDEWLKHLDRHGEPAIRHWQYRVAQSVIQAP